MAKYVGGAQISVPITPQLSVVVAMGSLAATLVWSSATREHGRLDEAIGLLQQVREAAPHKTLTVSLCELLSLQSEWQEVIELAAGTANSDDIDLQTLIYYGSALSNVGRDDAALVVYKEALKSSKRDHELLWWARYRRAAAYLRLGSKARARTDFARIYAENPNYADVAQQLAGLGAEAVVAIRCTKKLLARVASPQEVTQPATTVLGDWYASPRTLAISVSCC